MPARSKSSSSANSDRSRTRSNRGYLRVGVTGGIGAGKSAACRIFRSLGRTVLEADSIARTLMLEDQGVREAIIAAFGSDTYLPNGELNKETIGTIVFDDDATRTQLNAIVHPRVITRITRTLESLPAAARTPYALVEAALIYESGMENELDYIVVVHADDDVRIRRIMARDDIDHDAVARKLGAQLSSSILRRNADFVIDNNGDEESLRASVHFIDNLLSHLLPGSA